ncbi:PREDICTED: uncharacterized protein LOC104607530 [Nelumbo nucifera]|uniref:Uncharacterized protein LOC104607530 n=1 Tax=Nelumbo nucifera TaxID=4432 RepID=A0A1U8AXQ3_NELNU|nr:PREDICTED: uncharacterized protein LOC104607530 [Nelumbo nucifera]
MAVGKEDEGDQNQIQAKGMKGKSCKGCLYYSSILKSKSRNPRCVGVSRTLQQVPGYIVGESEMEASKEGRGLTDFKYACVGYSVYLEGKDASTDSKEKQAELPFCVGIELLVDKRPSTADHAPVHTHNREDGHVFPQPRTYKPAHSIGEEFLSRFTRNASLVASGVARNMYRVGNYIKDNLDDILYPYRRRPK